MRNIKGLKAVERQRWASELLPLPRELEIDSIKSVRPKDIGVEQHGEQAGPVAGAAKRWTRSF